MKVLEGEFSRENLAVELPRYLKQKIVDEILHRLRSLNSSSTNIAKERGECVLVLLHCASIHRNLLIVHDDKITSLII